MESFVRHSGVVAPLDRVNVDTDQIIPKQFLKRIERSGFGEFLFFDWRSREDGTPDPDFELNRPGYEEASVLVAGR
ncbi:MAG TPA: 3-isopropylmalate dehydratase small subunit, partial [Chloroflexota bacterium]|nr:3-isopropylmalate dehydratase small subunit [Chloroflexota bacterium]